MPKDHTKKDLLSFKSNVRILAQILEELDYPSKSEADLALEKELATHINTLEEEYSKLSYQACQEEETFEKEYADLKKEAQALENQFRTLAQEKATLIQDSQKSKTLYSQKIAEKLAEQKRLQDEILALEQEMPVLRQKKNKTSELLPPLREAHYTSQIKQLQKEQNTLLAEQRKVTRQIINLEEAISVCQHKTAQNKKINNELKTKKLQALQQQLEVECSQQKLLAQQGKDLEEDLQFLIQFEKAKEQLDKEISGLNSFYSLLVELNPSLAYGIPQVFLSDFPAALLSDSEPSTESTQGTSGRKRFA